jgi:predicted RecB family nuclease
VQLIDGRLFFSPTDLSNFLVCRHKTSLDLLVAYGELALSVWTDPLADVLRERGQRHEAAYIDALRERGLRIVNLTEPADRPRRPAAAAVERTLAAMRDEADVIVQAPVAADGWFGYVDVLRRIEEPSALGPWSYEVHDTKLSRETKGGTILQLCTYTDLLGSMLGRVPESFGVVTPAALEKYRFAEFGAYYRSVRAQFLRFTAIDVALRRQLAATYPEPIDHCELCRWGLRCEAERRADDHLSFVAGLGRIQQTELEARDVRTLAALAVLPTPIEFIPSRGVTATYERLRHQAALQRRQRETRIPTFELLPIEEAAGLTRLPEPSPGDLFLDLEGDPFAREGGREYLFGLLGPASQREGPGPKAKGQGELPVGQQALPLGPGPLAFGLEYSARWAFTDAEERAAFEATVDRIMAALDAHPDMHIYHFAPYEPAAFKRLAGRHATREAEIDVLLRGGRFLDLYAIVRRALRAGVESYSIKQLEPFYSFVRDVDLRVAGDERRLVEVALELNELGTVTPEVRAAVEGYNRDDCRSTVELREWLETVRAAEIARGVDIPRPPLDAGQPTDQVKDRDKRAVELRAGLLARIAREGGPQAPPFVSPEHHALYLLAHLVDWHRREERVAYGEYHRLRELPDDALRDEPSALVDLTFVERVFVPTGRSKAAIDRYRYPVQENDVRPGDAAKLPSDETLGTIDAIDKNACIVDIKKRVDQNDVHPSTILALNVFNAPKQEEAICRIAARAIEHGLDGEGVVRSLLLKEADPAVAQRIAPGSDDEADFAVRIVGDLADSLLAVQGPPGAGKTYTGARMISALVAEGRRVGVLATSHKVIRKLLVDAAGAAEHDGVTMPVAHKPPSDDELPAPEGIDIEEPEGNPGALAFIQQAGGRVLGGTAWLWAREEFRRSVDVLFVDEAGQMSLANVLAVSEAARSLVLLGDPRQLDQPQRASHPDGVDISALEHLLDGHQTIPAHRGVFLPITYRLAPAICRFTSEVFYEGKLRPLAGLECQRIAGAGALDGAGLRVVDVTHDHCRNASDEEADVVADLVDRLLRPGVICVEFAVKLKMPRPERQMTPADILVVAPYNAHVARLRERLDARRVAVGTVDKFQGQEAPVVIYSMATSRPEDAPRGMRFLYSLNRLNVATSRGKCLCILVASPRLFMPECATPGEMRLASALCRFRELAGESPEGRLRCEE